MFQAVQNKTKTRINLPMATRDPRGKGVKTGFRKAIKLGTEE